nr:ankyrin repeat domain-containing protein [Nitrospirota bacterium]
MRRFQGIPLSEGVRHAAREIWLIGIIVLLGSCMTPPPTMQEAAIQGDTKTVLLLLDQGADVNARTGKAYLVSYDGDPAFVEQTGYPLDRLYDRLASLPAKEVVVMLDSCFSGAGGRSVIGKGMRPMVLSVENPLLAKGKVVVLAASGGEQVSSTYNQQSHGLMTYFFLKGFQGEADVNRDSRIELRELYEYLKPQVERTARREFHNEQQPQLLGNPDILNRGIVLMGAGKP